MSLKKEAAKLAHEWQETDPLLRDELLKCARKMHEALAEVMGLIPKSLIDQTGRTLIAALPSLVMGKSVESVVLEALSAIPELSPYVRQLLGE